MEIAVSSNSISCLRKADELITKFGGLPDSEWLKSNFPGLHRDTVRNPGLYSKFKRLDSPAEPDRSASTKENSDGQTDNDLDDFVLTLMREHGKIPTISTLRRLAEKTGDIRHRRLINVLKNSPASYRAMELKHCGVDHSRPRLSRSAIEAKHLTAARRLADEHGGLVPGCSWLMENGFAPLYKYRYRNPDKFAGIKFRGLDDRSEIIKRNSTSPASNPYKDAIRRILHEVIEKSIDGLQSKLVLRRPDYTRPSWPESFDRAMRDFDNDLDTKGRYSIDWWYGGGFLECDEQMMFTKSDTEAVASCIRKACKRLRVVPTDRLIKSCFEVFGISREYDDQHHINWRSLVTLTVEEYATLNA